MTVGWFMKGLMQYADFRTRARRREYWWFLLIAYLVQVAMISFTAVMYAPAFEGETYDPEQIGLFAWIMGAATVLVGLALLIPYWAVTVRRLHDTDHSAWWVLFLLIFPPLIWIFAAFDGTVGPNRYGEDPKHLERGPEA